MLENKDYFLAGDSCSLAEVDMDYKALAHPPANGLNLHTHLLGEFVWSEQALLW